MSHASDLHGIGLGLVRRFGTRDPFAIAEGLGITVLECPDFGPLQGMYRVIKRNRFLFLNRDLDERMKRIVCAHEIGHDRLHRRFASGSALEEFRLYDMTNIREYEANIVAASILLDDETLLEWVQVYHYSAEQIARAMDTDVNLVALEIAHLNEMGMDLRPIRANSLFLRSRPERGGEGHDA